jgi:hypothetical protein
METDLTTTQSNALALPDEATFKRDIEAINRFQQIVHANLVKDLDYGVIPGTTKPTLLKPGAEKIAKLLGLSDQYIILDRQEDWNKPFFRYLVKCQLISIRGQVIVSEGLGECNSYESKYRYRDSKRKCPTCGSETIIKGKEEYGGGWLCFKKSGGCGAKFDDNDPQITDQVVGKVENEDIFSLVNTLIKMAKKRALVDASLSAGRLSNVFTQDMEDIVPERRQTNKPTTIEVEQVSGPVNQPQNKGDQQVSASKTGPDKNKPSATAYKTDPATITTLGKLWQALIRDFPEAIADTADCLKWSGFQNAADIKNFGQTYIDIAEKISKVS